MQMFWDCWEDGAIEADRMTGRYIDPAKVHALSHESHCFQVRGPLNISRSPQGQPVILQAGASEPGRPWPLARPMWGSASCRTWTSPSAITPS
jgi:alkanesulfonate monooxygenase SsuD/methylene tetrahydromethanopterin reductase-like flavin-dependent oxidoreductase (luciferase family)